MNMTATIKADYLALAQILVPDKEVNLIIQSCRFQIAVDRNFRVEIDPLMLLNIVEELIYRRNEI